MDSQKYKEVVYLKVLTYVFRSRYVYKISVYLFLLHTPSTSSLSIEYTFELRSNGMACQYLLIDNREKAPGILQDIYMNVYFNPYDLQLIPLLMSCTTQRRSKTK